MPQREWSRRDVLRQCLAAGVMIVPAGWGEAEALHAWFEGQTALQPTAHVEMGLSTGSAHQQPRSCGLPVIRGCR